MNLNIKQAVEAVANAEKELRAVLRVEQSKCDHPRVLHSPWRSSDFVGAFRARRICLECGLEEEAKYSGWGDNDLDFNHLKTKGFHKTVSSEELYAARIPEAAVDGLLGEEAE